MSIENDIETLIGELTPEQIKSLMKDVKKPTIRRIDNTHRQKRMDVNSLYFSAEPSPHQFDGSWKEYDGHRDMIREQVMREVYNE
jgi:hypothetical protein